MATFVPNVKELSVNYSVCVFVVVVVVVVT